MPSSSDISHSGFLLTGIRVNKSAPPQVKVEAANVNSAKEEEEMEMESEEKQEGREDEEGEGEEAKEPAAKKQKT